MAYGQFVLSGGKALLSMAKNILVISCDIAETRVALIENGIIAELHIERRGAQPRGGIVGDVYLGKVTRVLPGLQAAFVDIGLERAAFLHVEDLIRPDDFETYLAGGRKHALGSSTNGAAGESSHEDVDVAAVEAAEEAVANTEEAAEEVAGRQASTPQLEPFADSGEPPPPADSLITLSVEEETPEPESLATLPGTDEDDSIGDDEPGHGESVAGVAGEEALAFDDRPTANLVANPESEPPPPPAHDLAPLDDLLDDPNLPGFTVSDPGEPMPRAPAPRLARRDDRGGGGGGGGDRNRRRRGRGRGRGREPERGGGNGGGGAHRESRPRQSATAGRLSKSTPIRDVVKEGQEIIVQITKEPISTKGARCSSHISLPGRYVVYLPTLEHVGVSKRIGSDKERARLRETIESMKPPTGGLIVRTVAEGLTKKQLKQDVGYLVRLWGEVAKNREGARAPANLSERTRHRAQDRARPLYGRRRRDRDRRQGAIRQALPIR